MEQIFSRDGLYLQLMKNISSPVLFGALCSLSAVAVACRFARRRRAQNRAATIGGGFVGRVTSVEKLQSANQTPAGNKFQFAVSKKWKGVAGNSVSIVSNGNSAACGINFDTDRDYLVYAFKDKGDDQLRTNLCTRTKRVADADAD